MLTGTHTLIYSSDPTATRAFLRDVLQWPCVTEGDSDEPSEWLIFRTGPSETGVHPTTGQGGEVWGAEGHHEITLMCDDVAATIEELRGRGAEFDGDPEDLGWGVGVRMRVPGSGSLLLYEPRHPTAYDL
jgi:catechol 2,3-dioxygenase-like lactoylglutathione lyase family enzyme